MKIKLAVLGLMVAGLVTGPAQAGLITHFEETFDGEADDYLNGTTPGTTTGNAAWEGIDIFKADGSFSEGTMGSITLAFAPEAGRIYTLDGRLENTVSDSWLGFGFTDGQSDARSYDRRFLGDSAPVGRVWMLVRGDDNTGAARTFLGSGSDGETDSLDADPSLTDLSGETDLRIVLDTRPETWTATWYAKEAAAANYTQVRETTDILDNQITSVGFSISGDASGPLHHFSLTSIPEPSSWLLLLSALACGLLVRRRRGKE